VRPPVFLFLKRQRVPFTAAISARVASKRFAFTIAILERDHQFAISRSLLNFDAALQRERIAFN